MVLCEIRLDGAFEDIRVRYCSQLKLSQFFRVDIVPLFELGHRPTLAFCSVVMDTNPEENPEKRLQIMVEVVFLSQKKTNSHKSPGPRLTSRSRRPFSLLLDGKVQVNQKRWPGSVFFVIVDNQIASGNVTL